MKAFLKNYRQSPRKVRLVTDLIKGKRVADAIVILDNLPKRASLPIKKLLDSAISNAKSSGVNEENLFIENATVNKGIVLKRSMPRARGSASRINKRTSHLVISLIEKNIPSKSKKKNIVKEEEENIASIKVASTKSKTIKKTEVKK